MSEQVSQKSKFAKRTLSVSLFLLISIMLVFALQERQVSNSGVIVMGGGLEVYQNDKTSPLLNIDWGTLEIGASKYCYGWLHLQTPQFIWFHSAPNYLILELYVEYAPNVWRACQFNQSMSCSIEWMRFYFQLSPNVFALPPSPDGIVRFNFNITFSTVY